MDPYYPRIKPAADLTYADIQSLVKSKQFAQIESLLKQVESSQLNAFARAFVG